MNRSILGLVFLLIFSSCASDGQKGRKEVEEPTPLAPQYYYYPKANVYFDSANKAYFFQAGDSLSWQSSRQIPAVVLALMDKGVLINDAPDPVWKNNATHRLVYSAVLYATPADTVLAKKAVKPVRKTQLMSSDSAAMKAGRDRKGLGGLLHKIFGKKKKKEAANKDSMKRSR